MSNRTPEAQANLDVVAQLLFGRKPQEGVCILCESTWMSPGDFKDDLSLRESKITNMCQFCQDDLERMYAEEEE